VTLLGAATFGQLAITEDTRQQLKTCRSLYSFADDSCQPQAPALQYIGASLSSVPKKETVLRIQVKVGLDGNRFRPHLRIDSGEAPFPAQPIGRAAYCQTADMGQFELSFLKNACLVRRFKSVSELRHS